MPMQGVEHGTGGRDSDVGENLGSRTPIPALGGSTNLFARQPEPGGEPGDHEKRKQRRKPSRSRSRKQRKTHYRPSNRTGSTDPPEQVSEGRKRACNPQNHPELPGRIRPSVPRRHH